VPVSSTLILARFFSTFIVEKQRSKLQSAPFDVRGLSRIPVSLFSWPNLLQQALAEGPHKTAFSGRTWRRIKSSSERYLACLHHWS
jgi:hypothetical protein